MITKSIIKRRMFDLLTRLRVHPNTWSVGNAFKVHEFRELADGSGLRREDAVLDLGCGEGLQTELLASRCARAVGIDVSAVAIHKAFRRMKFSHLSGRLQFICGPLEDANLRSDSFDHVFSFCVLEHIPNLDVVLAELYRILKPGGEMHVTVDSLGNIKDPALIARHRADHFVVEYFTPASIRDRLSEIGFEVTESYPIFTSPMARDEFSERITNGGSLSLLGKMRLYRQLRREDNRSSGTEGIMVLVRARKPAVAPEPKITGIVNLQKSCSLRA